MFKEGYLKESLVIKYGFGAWFRQECAFSDALIEDTSEAFGELCKEQILR
jgi:hypothetical protein